MSLGGDPRGCSWKHPARACLSASSPCSPPGPAVMDCVIEHVYYVVDLFDLRAKLQNR